MRDETTKDNCQDFMGKTVNYSHILGPLHMSPVDKAGLVTTISPHSYFLCISMCSYEKAGQPVAEISVVETKISTTGIKVFPYEHLSPGNISVLFLKFHPGQQGWTAINMKDHKICPSNRASLITRLIWRGPCSTSHLQGQKKIFFSFIWQNLCQSFYLMFVKENY